LAERIQLGRGLQAYAHQLGFIHDPEAVVVEQGEVDGPSVAAHAITAVHGPAEEHVLGADYDAGFFGVHIPVSEVRLQFLTAHEYHRGMGWILRGAVAGHPMQLGKRRI
jgi:hypothetical protein